MRLLKRPLVQLILLMSAVALAAACSEESLTASWQFDDNLPGICENGCEPLSSCDGTLPGEERFARDESHASLTDLELEPTGCPRVLFEWGEVVEYAEWDGQEWVTAEVAQNAPISGSFDVKSDLAIDSYGNPSAGVIDAEGRVQFLQRGAAGSWHSEHLSDVERRSHSLLHEIDPDGRPVMLVSSRIYEGETSTNRLHYVFRGNDGWTVEELPATAPNTKLLESLSFDRDGRPHVAFSGDGFDGVFYAVRDQNADWSVIRIVDEEQAVGSGASLALDANDNPHVLFCPPPAVHDVKMASHLERTSSGWQSRVVDREQSYMPWCNALGFDAENRLHAVYLWNRGISRTELRHATFDGAAWSVETLATRDFLKPAPQMAIDSRLGIIHVLAAEKLASAQLSLAAPGYFHFSTDRGDVE